MSKVAIIDIDGVIANSEARFAKAEEAKAAYLEEMADKFTLEWNQVKQSATDLYWRTAFTPDLVKLDTLIDGTKEAIARIRWQSGYDVYLLTSRPESMRQATEQWLDEHELWIDNSIALPNWLIMKPDSQKFVKTVVWKSGVVEVLARLFGADDLLVVDDEETTQTAIHALDICDKYIAGSLQEALAMIGEKL